MIEFIYTSKTKTSKVKWSKFKFRYLVKGQFMVSTIQFFFSIFSAFDQMYFRLFEFDILVIRCINFRPGFVHPFPDIHVWWTRGSHSMLFLILDSKTILDIWKLLSKDRLYCDWNLLIGPDPFIISTSQETSSFK